MFRTLSLTCVALAMMFTSCEKNNKTSSRRETAEQKLQRYQVNIEGVWKWVPIPTQTLVLNDGKSLYIVDGKPDKDTGSYFLSTENPNPNAGYFVMAQAFSACNMVFFRMQKKPTPDHTVANRKKAYAIIGMNDSFMQMIDTETGTIWEFKK